MNLKSTPLILPQTVQEKIFFMSKLVEQPLLSQKKLFLLVSNIFKWKCRDIFKLATRATAENSRIVLEQAGLQKTELDWLIPHRANIWIIETVAKFLEMDMNKVIVTIEKYGNKLCNYPHSIPRSCHWRTPSVVKPLCHRFWCCITSGSMAIRF